MPTITTVASTVDVNIPRLNQAAVAFLTAIAFVIESTFLVVTVFVVLAVSRIAGPRRALFTQIYVNWIRPTVASDRPLEVEPAEPPRFAQLIGTIVLGAASVALVANWAIVGWALTLIVTALAGLAATTRICVGCMLYQKTVAR